MWCGNCRPWLPGRPRRRQRPGAASGARRQPRWLLSVWLTAARGGCTLCVEVLRGLFVPPQNLKKSLTFIMTGSKNGNETEAKSPRESGEDSEDESEILEESPCGRWSKRRQEVGEPSMVLVRHVGQGQQAGVRWRGWVWAWCRRGLQGEAWWRSQGQAGGEGESPPGVRHDASQGGQPHPSDPPLTSCPPRKLHHGTRQRQILGQAP